VDEAGEKSGGDDHGERDPPEPAARGGRHDTMVAVARRCGNGGAALW
jgi:hypothetical protein